MSKEKISQMPVASSVTGSELIPVVQSGVNKTITPIVLNAIPINEQTASYVLQLSDNLKMVILTTANASTITVPPDVFPVGAMIVVVAGGAGQITLVEGSGVAINSADDALKLRTQFSTGNLTQTLLNTWLLSGDLEV